MMGILLGKKMDCPTASLALFDKILPFYSFITRALKEVLSKKS